MFKQTGFLMRDVWLMDERKSHVENSITHSKLRKEEHVS